MNGTSRSPTNMFRFSLKTCPEIAEELMLRPTHHERMDTEILTAWRKGNMVKAQRLFRNVPDTAEPKKVMPCCG